MHRSRKVNIFGGKNIVALLPVRERAITRANPIRRRLGKRGQKMSANDDRRNKDVVPNKALFMGAVVWHSWQSGCFRLQRSEVRIQSLAILFTISCIKNLYCKDENKEKRGQERPNFIKKTIKLVAAQMADWLPPTPEIRGSNPVVSIFYWNYTYLLRCQYCKDGNNQEQQYHQLDSSNLLGLQPKTQAFNDLFSF